MGDLRASLERLDLAAPRTLLQSGNAVFGSRLSPRALEARLEAEGRARLSLDTPVIVRTEAEWDAIVDGNPFRREATADPSHVLVMCLKSKPQPGVEGVLQAAIKERERFHLHDRQAYLVYPDGIGTSKLTLAAVEKALGVVGTARNWNTVRKIQELLKIED
jgi:uncharacterized protein (DUF1697 family)